MYFNLILKNVEYLMGNIRLFYITSIFISSTNKVYIYRVVQKKVYDVVVAIVNNQKSRLILVNMEVLHWRV